MNEFRFSWVQRDLLFPENDPTSPTPPITGLFTIGGINNFPQARVTDSYQFSNVADLDEGPHTLKFGADVRYNKTDNQSVLRHQGHFTFNNLQDYMNNTAFQLHAGPADGESGTRSSGRRSSSSRTTSASTPDLTLNIGLRYELSDVPLGFFGSDRPGGQRGAGAAAPPRRTRTTGRRASASTGRPARATACSATARPSFRGGFGMGYDVLFYNLLTVND